MVLYVPYDDRCSSVVVRCGLASSRSLWNPFINGRTFGSCLNGKSPPSIRRLKTSSQNRILISSSHFLITTHFKNKQQLIASNYNIMRLLTHNTLRNNSAEAKGKGFPLRITATEIRVEENNEEVTEQQLEFVKNMLSRIDWPALVKVSGVTCQEG